MFSIPRFYKKIKHDRRRARMVERVLDERLTDHGLLDRATVEDAQRRIDAATLKLVDEGEERIRRLVPQITGRR